VSRERERGGGRERERPELTWETELRIVEDHGSARRVNDNDFVSVRRLRESEGETEEIDMDRGVGAALTQIWRRDTSIADGEEL